MDGQGVEKQYVPRGRGPTVLQRAVQEGLSAFLAEAEELGGLPTSLVKEFHAAITCGDVTRGFVTVRCNQCGEELRLGFTCHGRTVCPACTARRAASTAVHLVEEVLPHCAYRHYPEISSMWSRPAGSEGNDRFLLDIKAGRSSDGPAR